MEAILSRPQCVKGYGYATNHDKAEQHPYPASPMGWQGEFVEIRE